MHCLSCIEQQHTATFRQVGSFVAVDPSSSMYSSEVDSNRTGWQAPPVVINDSSHPELVRESTV